jgi:hypothetical protein
MEERELAHAAGRCCVIRSWPKDGGPKGTPSEMLCPNLRLPEQCKCEHHTAQES